MKPIIIINFKTYKKSSGDNALVLAKEISRVKRSEYIIVSAPSLLTVREVSQKSKGVIFAQHADSDIYGAHTGSILLDELKQAGVKGVILNHSEKKITFSLLTETIELCRKKKMATVVCASKLSEVKKIAALHPTFIAYEPSDLIGGDISVTTANPDIIVKAVEIVKGISKKTKVLCGAGIHSREDVGHALMLGTYGVLLSHAVVSSKDPKKFLEKMLI